LAKQSTNQIPQLSASRPDVGPALEAVLTQALQADKQARFIGAAEFLMALNRAVRRDARRSQGPRWLAGLKKRLFRSPT
jgi:hypothetical protein